MELPFKVDALDDVPEAARDLYVQDGDVFKLPVTGVKAVDDVASLERAYERMKVKVSELKALAERVSDDDIAELETLREEKRQASERKQESEGKLDEIRAQWKKETADQIALKEQEIADRDRMIRDLAIESQLRAAIAEAGILPEYQRAAYLELSDLGPNVKVVDGRAVGVFPDDVHGDKTVAEYVKSWAGTDDAAKYLPPETGGGGGGHGDVSSRGKSWEGKKFSEMTPDEQVAYTDAQYGGAAA